MSNGYTLSDIQRMREEWDIAARLARVEREHRIRQLIGDDVYDFVQANPTLPLPAPAPVEQSPVERAHAQIKRLNDFAQELLGEEGQP